MASSSRVFILLGLMLAIVLLVSSEVAAVKDIAATDQTETKEETAKTNGVEESKHGGGGGNSPGYGDRGRGGRSGSDSGGCRNYFCGPRRCCTYAGEAKDAQMTSTEPQN